MQQHRALDLQSYDRLFPSQDTLPDGGFGNLIALPLQGQRRQLGNSVFLDQHLLVIEDPWSALLQLKALSLIDVNKIITELGFDDNGLDLKASKQTIASKTEQALPKNINISLSNNLAIPKDGLPIHIITQLKKLAAFQNPEFYRYQAMRLSTFGKPRVINCSESSSDYIYLPRGILQDVNALFAEYKIICHIKLDTEKGSNIDVKFLGSLRSNQQSAVTELLKHHYGVLVANTGFGKTVVAANIIASRQANTLILVHRQQLLEQWQARLSTFLSIEKRQLGQLGNGKNTLGNTVDIAMLQSLVKKGEVNSIVENYGQIIVDECHHISAFNFEAVLKKAKAHYVLGLTATPTRKDGHHPIVFMQCGPIQYKATQNHNNMDKHIKHTVILRKTTITYAENDSPNMNDLYQHLMTNEKRNEHVFNDVLLALEDNRHPILLTERLDHLKHFENKFKNFVKNLFVLHGKLSQKERQKRLETLTNLPLHEERLVIAIGRYIGEGFDEPSLDTLFLTLPISWQGNVQQYVGRLHRYHDSKEQVQVFDYVDENIPMLERMFFKRLKAYKAMGYETS